MIHNPFKRNKIKNLWYSHNIFTYIYFLLRKMKFHFQQGYGVIRLLLSSCIQLCPQDLSHTLYSSEKKQRFTVAQGRFLKSMQCCKDVSWEGLRKSQRLFNYMLFISPPFYLTLSFPSDAHHRTLSLPPFISLPLHNVASLKMIHFSIIPKLPSMIGRKPCKLKWFKLLGR